MMRLYFIRHGQSEANANRIISNRGYQHGLTETGIQQAVATAQNLYDAEITRLYHSPLLRAEQTAHILGKAWGLPGPYPVVEALREYDCGVLEDKSDEESWIQHRALRQDWFRREWDRRIEGGESFYDIQARFVPFVESLISQYGQTNEQIALVGHGGTYRYMMPQVLDNIDLAFAEAHNVLNAGCIIGELRGDKLICTQWCDTILP